MSITQDKTTSVIRQPHRRCLWAAAFLAMAFAGVVHAGNIYVPNYSFESPVVPEVNPYADNLIAEWQETPQPSSYNPSNNFNTPWTNLVGEFYNIDIPGAYIDNIDGVQAALMQNYPGVGLLQDENSVGITNAAPDHAFNATYKPGKVYTLTVGLTSSTFIPLAQGATLQLSLYYRDSHSNMVTVAASTVTFDTNVFTNLTHLTDFQVVTPHTAASDPWSGQNIGIQLLCTSTTNDLGGYWDADNVRLLESIYVPNYSFESPAVPEELPFATNLISEWEETSQPSNYNPSNNFDTPWSELVGAFYNVNFPGSYISNIDGVQAAFLEALPGVGLFQDYNSIGITGIFPDHSFNAVFNPGKAYTLTVGLTGSSDAALTQGSTLLLGLYYRDPSSNIDIVALKVVTYDTNVFTNLTELTDFQVQSAPVKPSDPWAGQHMGILILSTADTNVAGGYWDVDNVRLVETTALNLVNPTASGGQIQFTLQSEPGAVSEVLSTANLNTPAANWTSLGVFTNVTGSLPVTDQAASPQGFYTARPAQ